LRVFFFYITVCRTFLRVEKSPREKSTLNFIISIDTINSATKESFETVKESYKLHLI